MAAKQLQKTRVANTVTKTALTQAQSQEVVQVLLHSALSGLSYFRDFFSASAFDHEELANDDRIPSYRAYADGTLPPKQGPFTHMTVLRRGRNKRVDVFLDWLEKGVFAALHDRRLANVQVLAHPSREERDKVLEAYTFSIKYHSDDQGNSMIAGLEMDSPGNDALTVEATNQALQSLLRYVNRICKELPDLPEKRYISMTVSYREDSSESLKLIGFEPNETKKLLLASADGWEMTTRSPDPIHSAFHSTSFTIVHLHQPVLGALQAFSEHTGIPSQLHYKDEDASGIALSAAESGLAHEESTALAIPNSERSTIVPETQKRVAKEQRPDEVLDTPAPTAPLPKEGATAGAMGFSSLFQTLGRSAFEDSLDTQTSDAPLMKRAARSWMLPEHYTQGDTQTQQPLNSVTPECGIPDTPMQSPASTRGSHAPQKLRLLPAMHKQLQRSRRQLKKSALKLATPSLPGSSVSHWILCQCGHNSEEGAMVQCSYCETWQHLHCYGFTDNEDRRLPDQHACYRCVIGTTDQKLMAILQELVLKRRAMHYAIHAGLSTKKAFTASLGIDSAIAGPIWQYIHDEGFVATMEDRSRKRTSSKKFNIGAVQQGPAHDRMLRTLFDPLREISSFYLDSTEPGLENRAFMISPSMPPPKVPASQMKKSRKVQGDIASSPSSDLDIRPSIPSYDTPLRSRSPQRKRKPEADISTPNKRQATPARVKTLQSTCVLNADGQSSSPVVFNTPY